MDTVNSIIIEMLAVAGFLGAIATLYRYLVRPIARAITAVVEIAEKWRTVPEDVADVKQLLTTHIAQTDQRLRDLEPPLPYRHRTREPA